MELQEWACSAASSKTGILSVGRFSPGPHPGTAKATGQEEGVQEGARRSGQSEAQTGITAGLAGPRGDPHLGKEDTLPSENTSG